MFYFYKSYYSENSERAARLSYRELCFRANRITTFEVEYDNNIFVYDMTEEQYVSEFEAIDTEERQWTPVKI